MPPRQPKKNANQLSDADIAILQQARAAQNSLASLGIPSPMPEPKQIENTIELPPTQPQGYTSTSDVIKDYDNFIELTGLPSGGRFYNAPIYGQPLKVTDILQIQNVDESNVNQRFSEIFSRRFRGIDPYEILVADEMFLALWLRANSYPGFNFPNLPYVCTECNAKANEEESEFGFSQIKFEIYNLDELAAELDGKDHIYVTLPTCKSSVIIYLRRRKHQAMVEQIIKRDFTAFGREPDEEYVNLLTMASVIDVGVSDLKQVVEEIKEMNPVDFIFLIKQINKYSLSSIPVVYYECNYCGGHTASRGYPFRPEIFLPLNN